MFNDIFRGGGHHGVGTWFELTVVRVNRDDGCSSRVIYPTECLLLFG